MPRPGSTSRRPSLRRWGRYLAGGLTGLVGALLVWGVLVEPRLLATEAHVALLPGLPVAWEGERVAAFGDLQVGMWLGNTRTVRRVVARVIAERPALVLLLGDFIYLPGKTPGRDIDAVVALLRPLVEAGLPAYGVLGNHEYEATAEQGPRNDRLAGSVQQALEAAGVRVLTNEAVPLRPPSVHHAPGSGAADEPLYLVGIGSDAAGEAEPAKALGQVPAGAPRLVLMHHPKVFAALPAGSAPLALAGHTHGGQVRLPFLPVWTWAHRHGGRVQVAGWIEGYGAPGNRLYVNRGIGFSTLPLRLNAPPELTLFALRRARQP